MPRCAPRRLIGVAPGLLALAGCHSPLDTTTDSLGGSDLQPRMLGTDQPPPASTLRAEADQSEPPSLPTLDESATLADYLRYAALNNPGLESSFQQWRAAVERVPQVGALPDPRFTYGYFISRVETRVGPQEHQFMIAQTFPWFGRLQDRSDAAAHDANAAYRRYEAARLDLFYRVKSAYWELYYLHRSEQITQENMDLLKQFERVALARYRVGAANHPDLIRLHVELGKIEDRLRQLSDLRSPRTARLNAALNRPTDAPVPWPKDVPNDRLDAPAKTVIGWARRTNPSLLALDEQVERERKNTDAARTEGYPDFTLGLGYTIVGDAINAATPDNGKDPVLATISVNIPLWRDKYDAAVRESLARRLSLADSRLEQSNAVAEQIRQALFEHEDAQRRVALYRETLIPKAEESLRASLTGFQNGTTDFLELLDTERTLLEFRLTLQRARIDRAETLAKLEQLAGRDLPRTSAGSGAESEEEPKP